MSSSIDILLVGAGGREHAIAAALARSPRLGRLFAAPGNPGIATLAMLVPLDVEDHAATVAFCRREGIGLVVIGPEQPLVDGLVDALEAAGIAAFGPSAAAARLEASKGFTKTLARQAGIPTARWRTFDDHAAAVRHVRATGAPIVVKADGLAAGKGVTVADTLDEAEAALAAIFADGRGAVVIEERLEGPEASLFALCHGGQAIVLGTAEDHKRAFDGDQGPNTGGMGAVSPSPRLDPDLTERAMREIVRPTLALMAARGTPFRGVLYAGLMLTADGPKLIEYNVRLGDPEAQALLPRLDEDLIDLLLAAVAGKLDRPPVRLRPEAAVTVVVAAEGYPGRPRLGSPVGGVARAEAAGATVFQAGTRALGGALVAAGGRILAVTALGDTIAAARDRAYRAVRRLDAPVSFHRTDIALAAAAAERQATDA